MVNQEFCELFSWSFAFLLVALALFAFLYKQVSPKAIEAEMLGRETHRSIFTVIDRRSIPSFWRILCDIRNHYNHWGDFHVHSTGICKIMGYSCADTWNNLADAHCYSFWRFAFVDWRHIGHSLETQRASRSSTTSSFLANSSFFLLR